LARCAARQVAPRESAAGRWRFLYIFHVGYTNAPEGGAGVWFWAARVDDDYGDDDHDDEPLEALSCPRRLAFLWAVSRPCFNKRQITGIKSVLQCAQPRIR
jgi:hypothetical protein